MFRIIYFLGAAIRNPRIFLAKRDLDKCKKLSHIDLQDLQNKRLKALVKHAVKTSPFYAEKYMDVNINEINLNNIGVLPILTKSEYRENIGEIFSSSYDKSNCFLSETSGSTGEPLVFYRDKRWDAYHRAAIWRGLEQFGVKPWDKSLYLWGFIRSPWTRVKTQIFDLLQNRRRLFIYDDNEFSKIENYLRRVKFIHGYSSTINELAKKAIKNGKHFDKIRIVKGTSEKIFPEYVENVKLAFGCRLVSEYGAAETGIIAFECEYGHMHTVDENIILEVVGDRAVVTNLWSYSSPVIRYELGDYIELEKNTVCKCGAMRDVVREIIGRVGLSIYGKGNSYPSLTLYYVFKFLAIERKINLSYRAVQKTVGSVDLYLSDKSIIETYRNEISEAWGMYFGDDVDLNLCIDTKIFNKSSKMKDFESLISKDF